MVATDKPHFGKSIDELMSEHAENVALLRAEVVSKMQQAQALDPSVKYDDIWLLRYCVSNKGNLEAATKAAEATLDFRMKNNDMIQATIASGKTPNKDTIEKFQVTGETSAVIGGWPVYCVRTGYCDIRGLMNTMTEEQVVTDMGLNNELQWRRCDKLTRETRKMTKMINVIDLSDFSMFMGDKRFFKALGKSSEFSASHYPQLLGRTVIVNAPSYFRLLFRSFSVFMPKSYLEKQIVCPVASSGKDDIAKCPFVTKFGDAGALPDFLGGQGPCPGPLTLLGDRADALLKVTIGRKDKHTVELEVTEAPMKVAYTILVEAYGIGVSCAYKTGSEVLAYRKIKSEDGRVEGVFEATEAGILVVTLDNTYSMLRSKTVNFRFDMAT